MNEYEINEIIRKELRTLLKEGIKIGTHSIYLKPNEIDMDGNAINNVGEINFGGSGSSDIRLVRVSADSLSLEDNFHISGNLSVDGTYPTTSDSLDVDEIIVGSNTLTDNITFKVGMYSTIGVSWNTITIGSTIPSLQDITGSITPSHHTSLTHAYSDITGNPSGLTVETTLTIGTIATTPYLYQSGSLELRTNGNLITDGWIETKDGVLNLNNVILSRYGISTLSTDNLYLTGNLIVDGTVPQSLDVDSITIGSSVLTDAITFIEGSNMDITVNGQSITFSPDLTTYTGSLSALVIDSNKDWEGYGINNISGVTITGSQNKLVFDSNIGSQSIFPFVFPFEIGTSAGYSEIYADGNTLVVDSNLQSTGSIIASGYKASSGSLGLSTITTTTNNTLTFEDGLLTTSSIHTPDVISGSIITSMAFAYAGTLEVGNTIAPLLITPCSLDIIHVKAIVKTACTAGSIAVDINKDGTSIFTTQTNRPILEANSISVISSAPDVTSLDEDSVMSMDIDAIGSNSLGTDISVIVKCRQRMVFD